MWKKSLVCGTLSIHSRIHTMCYMIKAARLSRF
nr:MAG TPA: hypothetical protein [Caudoviricetes sp.]